MITRATSRKHELTPEQALQTLFGRITDVASLPGVAQHVIHVAMNPRSTAEDLRQAIQRDPALVARILRHLNSAYYSLSSQVCDLRRAISLLGFREVRNLAMTVFVSRLFVNSSIFEPYSREGLWHHCVGVAALSRVIARVCGRAVPEEAYIAGLLHDIGYIMLDQHMARYFSRVLREINLKTATPKVERRIYKFDHAQLGGFVLSKWKFPQPIVDAVEHHHSAEQYTGKHKAIVNIVSVANYLCSRFRWSALGVHNIPPPTAKTYSTLQIDQVTMRIICNQIPATLERAIALAHP
jgi:putative nucleotidyltransferase with HDIG domain